MSELINVAIFLKQKRVRDLLESQTSPVYKFVKMKNYGEMQFKVTDDGSHGDLAKHTKKLIRTIPNSSVIMFRVLHEGQAFEGGKY